MVGLMSSNLIPSIAVRAKTVQSGGGMGTSCRTRCKHVVPHATCWDKLWKRYKETEILATATPEDVVLKVPIFVFWTNCRGWRCFVGMKDSPEAVSKRVIIASWAP